MSLEQGVNIRVIQRYLGHARPARTEKSLHELAAVAGVTDALDGDAEIVLKELGKK
jgi:hypothetical protein